ncbi:MAG TPA: efflux RND transporter periplasmic adaptor subunit [bacterium]|jgi:membrane fusion protein (multidrug efflux system)/multidrug efflux system membrane fusion protein
MKFPVEVATVATHAGDLAVHAVGSLEAFETVQVTARVTGAVQKVRFREGENVRAGEPLVEIEPERFDLAVKSAEAVYERAKAGRREALAGLARREDIQGKNPGFVSPEDLDNWQTKAMSARADSIEAAAALELAKLNKRDAYVPAPVSGIIQSRTVRTGDYILAGTLIATMLRRDPLLLRFSVPDQEAQRLRPGLNVTFRVRGETQEYKAKITAVTESADPVTRMVSVVAEVNDPQKEELRPGAFAEVTVLLGDSQSLPVIPQLSIRPSEKGFLAYVVQDSVAKERVLTLGLQSSDGFVEVTNGLKSGELVVVRGAEALRDGAGVRVISPSDSTGGKGKAGKKA